MGLFDEANDAAPREDKRDDDDDGVGEIYELAKTRLVELPGDANRSLYGYESTSAARQKPKTGRRTWQLLSKHHSSNVVLEGPAQCPAMQESKSRNRPVVSIYQRAPAEISMRTSDESTRNVKIAQTPSRHDRGVNPQSYGWNAVQGGQHLTRTNRILVFQQEISRSSEAQLYMPQPSNQGSKSPPARD
ncbi:hypothetical protein CHU98_g9979 [Xylaria longipes]|nr:hypothetical protein CHU98_g9979 [Xylaria longipes]